MNLLRTAVSGKRNRYRDGDFDLDLSYITPRIIAMAYPATGTEGMYRNNILDVGRFLNLKHGDNFMVFNLSERHYDNGIFGHRVMELGWPDHAAPPLEVAWTVCRTMDAWLSAAPDNVVVIHCLAGKGRTGVIIACYILFSGLAFGKHLRDAAVLAAAAAAGNEGLQLQQLQRVEAFPIAVFTATGGSDTAGLPAATFGQRRGTEGDDLIAASAARLRILDDGARASSAAAASGTAAVGGDGSVGALQAARAARHSSHPLSTSPPSPSSASSASASATAIEAARPATQSAAPHSGPSSAAAPPPRPAVLPSSAASRIFSAAMGVVSAAASTVSSAAATAVGGGGSGAVFPATSGTSSSATGSVPFSSGAGGSGPTGPKRQPGKSATGSSSSSSSSALAAGSRVLLAAVGSVSGGGGGRPGGAAAPERGPGAAAPSDPGALLPLPPPSEMAREVLTLFRSRRGEGVKHPSQIRTVRYFARVVHDALLAEHFALQEQQATAGEAHHGGSGTSPQQHSSSGPHRGGAGTSGSSGGGARPLPPDSAALVAMQAVISAIMERGLYLESTARVLAGAVFNLRKLKSLPLPKRTPVVVSKVIMQCIPAVPGGFSPLLHIMTAPYQGGHSRIIYSSAWHSTGALGAGAAEAPPSAPRGVYPAPDAAAGASTPIGALVAGAGGIYSAGDNVIVFPMAAHLQGDILVRCYNVVGGAGAGGAPATTALLFYASFHTTFMSREGVPGVYRLTLDEVDMEHRKRIVGLFPAEFTLDFIYRVEAEGEGEAGGGGGAGTAAPHPSLPTPLNLAPAPAPHLSPGAAQLQARALGGSPSPAHTAHAPSFSPASLPSSSSSAATPAALPSPSSSGTAASDALIRFDTASRRTLIAPTELRGYTGAGHDASPDLLAVGALIKRGALIKGWKRRWFVLRPLPCVAAAAVRELRGSGAVPGAGAGARPGPSNSVDSGGAGVCESPITAASSVSPAAGIAGSFDDDEEDEDDDEDDEGEEGDGVPGPRGRVGSGLQGPPPTDSTPPAPASPPSAPSGSGVVRSVSSTDPVAVLMYYVTAREPVPKGTLTLTPLILRKCAALSAADGTDPKNRTDGKPHCFVIRIPGRSLYLQAMDDTDRDRWLAALRACIPVHMRSHAAPGAVGRGAAGAAAAPPAAASWKAGAGGGGELEMLALRPLAGGGSSSSLASSIAAAGGVEDEEDEDDEDED